MYRRFRNLYNISNVSRKRENFLIDDDEEIAKSQPFKKRFHILLLKILEKLIFVYK